MIIDYFFKKYPILINLFLPYIVIENIAFHFFNLTRIVIDNLNLKINKNKLKMTEYSNTTVLNLDDDDDIDDSENDNQILNDEDNFKKNIFDMSLSLELRINIILKYYSNHPEDFLEIISRINGMYSFSGTKTLEKFIYSVITETDISSFLKIECSMSLLNFKELEEEIFEKDEESFKEIKRKSNDEIKVRNDDRNLLAYNALNIVCSQLDENLSTPYKVETICELMKNDKYKEESTLYFFKIINNYILDCDYRYKTILSLERRDIIEKKFFIFESCFEFLKKTFNFTMYRILASQNLLQNFEIQDEKRFIIENTLLSFAKDEDLEYNLRADAADVLLNLGTENMQKEGRNIIFSLGQINGVNKTIFDNAQNVHVTEIEKSVLEIIIQLSNYPTMRLENNPIDYEYVQNAIYSIMDDLLKFESDADMVKKNRIQISFNRIYMDKALYFNNSVSNILVKVWSYINNNENKMEMIKRLVEELDEMSGTCSSGFASRIINSISGFGEFNLHISWEDQIVSNFSGRLNAYARKITNEDSLFFKDEIFSEVFKLFIIDNKLFSGMNLEMEDRKSKYLLNKNIENVKKECVEEFSEHVINEMTVTSSKFANRQHFLLFFKTYMPLIYKELFEEFKNLITDSEFDLSFRRAISVYEGDM